MSIPAGIDEGHQIRLTNEGEVGPRGGPPGSLYVAVHVAPHPSLRREGTELYYEATHLDRPGGPRHDDQRADRRWRGGGRDQTRDAAGHGDPAARQGRAASPPRRVPWRPPRPDRRRGAAQADQEATRAARAIRTRVRGHGRRGRRAASSTSSVWGDDRPSDDGATAAGAWLELAVEADPEAVEAVSEILGRVAAGGTTVEPGFDLVDEGLGARIDPSRPAVVRGYVPAGDRSERAAADAAAAQVAEALGHLQAFGLRQIGELQGTRTVQEADWADAWRAFFPVMRVGRRLVIRPTWRRHKAAPEDVVLALDPGHGVRDRPASDDPPVPCRPRATGRRRPAAGARVLDVGCGSGILPSPHSSSAQRRRSVSTPTRWRSKSTMANAAAQRPRRSTGGARGIACRPSEARSTSSSPTSWRAS